MGVDVDPQAPGIDLEVPVAEVFEPLFKPVRYKGLRGGRGGAKSHFVAGRMIEETSREHHRIACGREYQSSIKDSMKQLLEDKIKAFNLSHLYTITDREIRGPYDSLFVFKGLDGKSADSFKSLEGFDRFCNEEAQTTSQNSLEKITPTMRSAGAQMYFVWNPVSPKDPVDVMFRENEGDPDFVCIDVNFEDNPWFPEDLRRDMERDRKRDPDKYAHIWRGKYQKKSQSRVFSNWSIEYFETPKDARFYFGADWGFSIDPTVLIRCFLDESRKKLYIDQEAYKVGCKIDDTPLLFAGVDDSSKWPIRADSARPETIEYMQRHGYPRIEAAQKGPNSVADGIEFLKSFDIIVHPRCRYTSDELSFYSYRIDKKTNEVLPILDDKKNHVIDALRYAVEAIRKSKSIHITPEFAKAYAQMTKRR